MGILRKISLAARTLTDERYRYLYRQRNVTTQGAREAAAQKVVDRLPPGDQMASLEGDELRENGIAFLDGLISPAQVSEMRDWFTDVAAQDPHRPGLGTFNAPSQVPSESHVAYIVDEVVAKAPHALELANHPKVLAAVAQYLGAKPTISYMVAWWSIPRGGAAEGPENFHRDWDDYRFCKLFLYLTDVGEESGPHVFIRKSHRSDKLVLRRRFTDEEIAEAFPEEDHMVLTGPAGSHFLESTFGIHRGVPPTKTRRLIFQVLYSLSPHISGPRAPVRALTLEEAEGLDSFINRVYYRFP